MLIALAGRKGSGKTELARVCEARGFKRLSFAGPLKQLVSKMIGISVDELNCRKEEKKVYSFGDSAVELVSRETGIDEEKVSFYLKGREFPSIRAIMQGIGTDLIRKYDEYWHVDKLCEEISCGNGDFVIDDLRFNNEMQAVLLLGGHCWYVVRPTFDSISSHESETTLSWRCFDDIIVNNVRIEEIRARWSDFIRNYEENMRKKRGIEEKIRKSHCKLLSLFFMRMCGTCEKYFVYPDVFLKDDAYWDVSSVESAKPNFFEDCLYVKMIDGSVKCVCDPLLVELLKEKIETLDNC